jgi:predicted cobalt transporter CbtA
MSEKQLFAKKQLILKIESANRTAIGDRVDHRTEPIDGAAVAA